MKLVKKSIKIKEKISLEMSYFVATHKVLIGMTVLGISLLGGSEKEEIHSIEEKEYIIGSCIKSDEHRITLKDIVKEKCGDILLSFDSTDRYYVKNQIILNEIEKDIEDYSEILYNKDTIEKEKTTNLENQIKTLAEDISKNPDNYNYDNSIYTDGVTGYIGEFLVTGYCGCSACCGKSNGITADGSHATANHTVAADSRFAFGTELCINGVTYEVEDRGGAIKGNRIDRFFDNHSEALSFGKRTASVYSIDSSKNKTLALRYSK